MIDQGIWILAIMIYGARHEIILEPYAIYPNQQICEAWKGRESLELDKPMVCTRMQGDEL